MLTHCTCALIANELPLLPYGRGVRISQAVPAIRGCRLRVYIVNF